MGLDMYLQAKKYHSGYRRDENGEYVPKPAKLIDGMPLREETMELMYWRKNHWLHGFIVEEFADGEDDCKPVYISAEDAEKIADKLEEWADNPEALSPTDGFFFGVRPTDENYEEWRDEYRAEAKAEAKDIRRAVLWLRDAPDHEWRSLEYQASW